MAAPIKLKKRKHPSQTHARNEAVFLHPSATGRTVGFIVDIGRRNIPFDTTTAANDGDGENLLDALMDGSFLPFDINNPCEIEDMDFGDTFYNIENRLRRSWQFKDLTGKHLSELEFLMQHINMTEN